MQALERLPGLKALDLTGARISDDALRHVAGLDRLESLVLVGTHVGDEGMRHLAAITSLRYLDLTGTEVGDAGLAHLAGLKNLQTLRLAGTLITDGGMSYLRGFADLRILDLYGTGITGKGVLQLGGLRRIRELDLFGWSHSSTYEDQNIQPSRYDALLELGRRGSLPDLERFSAMESDNAAGLGNFPALRSLSLSVRKARDFEPLRGLKQLRALGLDLWGDHVDWPDSAWANLDALQNLESLVFFQGARPRTFRAQPALRHVGRLGALKYLRLDLVGASGYDLALLAPLRNLRHLELGSDALNAEELARLPKFEHLQFLSLSAYSIGERGLRALPKLESLKALDLCGCALTIAELGCLRKFPRLEELNLGAVSPADQSAISLYDPDLDELHALKSLRVLDLQGTQVTEEGIAALRHALPGLQTVKHDVQQRAGASPRGDSALPSGQAWFRQRHALGNVLVEALVSTYPIDPNGRAAHATVIQVYLGPQDLCGKSFVGQYPFVPNGYDVVAANGRLAKEELVLTHLERSADGSYTMPIYELPLFQARWPAWLVDPLADPLFGYLGPPSDFHRQRKLAEFLRTVSLTPERQQVAFLCERLIGGSDIEAQAAVDVLLSDPREGCKDRVFGPIEDDRLPLPRRILIDRTAAAWDWPNTPEAMKRIARLVAVTEALENKPLVTVRAKQDAVGVLMDLSQGAGRSQAFQALVRMAKDSSVREVRADAICKLSVLAPYNAAEARQVEALLQGIPGPDQQSLKEALAQPRRP